MRFKQPLPISRNENGKTDGRSRCVISLWGKGWNWKWRFPPSSPLRPLQTIRCPKETIEKAEGHYAILLILAARKNVTRHRPAEMSLLLWEPFQARPGSPQRPREMHNDGFSQEVEGRSQDVDPFSMSPLLRAHAGLRSTPDGDPRDGVGACVFFVCYAIRSVVRTCLEMFCFGQKCVQVIGLLRGMLLRRIRTQHSGLITGTQQPSYIQFTMQTSGSD
jgi:hypothetical protein